MTAKTAPGAQWMNSWRVVKVPSVFQVSGTPHITLNEPFAKSQPVPARNPPTTGYGMNLIQCPRRKRPTKKRNTPVKRELIARATQSIVKTDDEEPWTAPWAETPATMIATIAEMFASGPAMAIDDELRSATIKPITVALIRALVIPNCK